MRHSISTGFFFTFVDASSRNGDLGPPSGGRTPPGLADPAPHADPGRARLRRRIFIFIGGRLREMHPREAHFSSFPTLLGTRAAILKLSVAAEVPRSNPSQLTWRKKARLWQSLHTENAAASPCIFGKRSSQILNRSPSGNSRTFCNNNNKNTTTTTTRTITTS